MLNINYTKWWVRWLGFNCRDGLLHLSITGETELLHKSKLEIDVEMKKEYQGGFSGEGEESKLVFGTHQSLGRDEGGQKSFHMAQTRRTATTISLSEDLIKSRVLTSESDHRPHRHPHRITIIFNQDQYCVSAHYFLFSGISWGHIWWEFGQLRCTKNRSRNRVGSGCRDLRSTYLDDQSSSRLHRTRERNETQWN